ncbi:MAG: hypothetical protein E7773_05915 [Sphingomonas sp.]|uniref:hypothetical protein n=1 Tax=Sphingomonas sp. TaxID=28214 RepID=UPI0011FD2E2B|nr:hypothetical protein [Sphingomonas sp.]THD36546.1 MAG: hypothetical protein E7773_05915 [Sphingomonas sp.]
MKKIAAVLAAAGLVLLAACHKPEPTTENVANAMESDLVNNAAAMQAEADANANAAAANAMNSASATYSASMNATDAANSQ